VPIRALRRPPRACYTGYASLSEGILHGPADDLEPLLPAAPAGWTQAPWTMAQGKALTGAACRDSMLAVNTTNSILADFARSADDGFGAAAVHDAGSGLVAPRLRGDTRAMRAAGKGKAPPRRPSRDAAFTLVGLPVVRPPKYSTEARTGEFRPVA